MVIDAESWLKKAVGEKWQSGTIAPEKKGVYERLFTDGIFKNYWNGEQWLRLTVGEVGLPHWRQIGDYPCWRGV